MRLRLATLSACLIVAACDDTLCGDTVVQRLPAPDHRREAVLFQRDCGAPTGFSTQISILAPGSAPNGPGEVFVADDDHGAAQTGRWGGPWASMRWLDPAHLEIAYAENARIFHRKVDAAGVRIRYRVKVRRRDESADELKK
jgi:hypothetical protein